MLKNLRYDGTSEYETNYFMTSGLKLYSRYDYNNELRNRADYEKSRKELIVSYYRIGYKIAYPLPLCEMPLNMPEGIPGRSYYPWSIWLAWELRERWYALYYAWRSLKDREAGELLQSELASLSKWSTYFDGPGGAGLFTGHLASCLAGFLSDRTGWNYELYKKAESAAHKLLDNNIQPWYENIWEDKHKLTEVNLANIPCIVLMSSANLARVFGSRHLNKLDTKAREVFETWCSCRIASNPYTEGTAYDAYFLDSALEWIEGHPDKEAILKFAEPALETAYKSWINLTLPGRPDIHAPLGDVEPEMSFWMNTLERLTLWYGWQEGLWLLYHILPLRLTSEVLGRIHGHFIKNELELKEPLPSPKELVSAVSLRTGWNSGDVLVATSYGRTKTGHLHFDNGNIVIGRYGRFWITDPGYQQYRPGEERDFSIGPRAHNIPVINGTAQTDREAKLIGISDTNGKFTWAELNLTPCYENLENITKVTRKIYLCSNHSYVIVVRDEFKLTNDLLNADYSWHAGTNFAFSFKAGWGRISDELHALWIGCSNSSILPAQLKRHTGSRGPLNILSTCSVTYEKPVIWWVFCFDETGNWIPPQIEFMPGRLKLRMNCSEELIIDE